MSVKNFRIDTAELRRDRQAMERELNALEIEIKNIYNKVHELDSMWDGSANQAFNIQFKTDYEGIKKVLSEMGKFINKMDSAYNKYEKCENEIEDVLGAIRI